MASVLVIDASASVRETLRIVLGHEHGVVVAPALGAAPESATPDVIVLGLPPWPRDDRAIGTALHHYAPATPVLLLHAAADVDMPALVPPQVPVEFLPKPFDAYAVRARVRALACARRSPGEVADLSGMHRRRLEFPFLSATAATVVRRVITADYSVMLLQGEPGTGASAVARAIHAVHGEHGGFTALDGAGLAAGDLARRFGAGRDAGTLYLANVDLAKEEVQHDLLQLLENLSTLTASSLRVIVSARDDLGELAAAGRFVPELAYMVTTLPVVLTPLRDRSEDIPFLVAMLSRETSARLRLGEVTYSPAALERLRQYLWFGNITELAAVLTRTLALHQPKIVEAEQLLFLPEDAPRAVVALTSPPPRGIAARASAADVAHSASLATLDLEVVLGELAHELRNPMVTIKTFAQHLESVLADPDVRARFSSLTMEAIDRMDVLLETLLDFSRFGAPIPKPLDVQSILDRALGDCTDDLARRHVSVERNGVGVGSVDADEAQVLFALRSLCRGLVADLVPHSALKIRGRETGVVELEVRAEPSTAARLAAWVEPRSQAGVETPPLAWALAAALLERNGGALTACKGESGSTVIRVDLDASHRSNH